MSKSPKTVREGDERNLYLRRIKTTNVPLKQADPNDRLTVKQSDSTRSSIVGTSQRSNVHPNRNFKSKLASPIKAKSIKSSRVTNHLYLQTLRGDKRPQSSSTDHFKARTMKVQNQEGSDSTVSHSKGLKKEIPKSKNKSEENVDKERVEKKVENNQADGSVASNTNGKAPESGSEPQSHSEDNVEKESKDKGENNMPTEIPTTNDTKHDEEVKEIDSKSSNGKEEASKPEDKRLEFDQPRVEIEIIDISEQVEPKRSTSSLKDEENSSKSKKEECLSGSDVVESTTSESPAGQQPEPEKEQENSQNKDEDGSFISYDSNIMLKDVQIKLNDCLKENSKLFDTTDPNASLSENFKDQSFGRTLRGISGRTSLGRLRNVTIRERCMSPNDSLFVNTSRVSISQDRSIYAENIDSPFNYSRVDRKRKRVGDIEPMTKKIKTEEGYNFLSFSWDYLKHWRRPDHVSTPNTKEFNMNLDDTNKIEDDTMNVEETTETKKWCIVM